MDKLVDIFERVMGARDSYFGVLKRYDESNYDPHGHLKDEHDNALEDYEHAIKCLLDIKQPKQEG